jgi:hypothetical protein
MSSVEKETYGFNYKTLVCGKMRIDQWISAFGTEAGAREREEALENSIDVQWLPADACNPEECNVERVCVDCSRCYSHCSCNHSTKKQEHRFGNALRWDPRTCTSSNLRVGVAGSEAHKCDRKKCNDMYFCEDCNKCRQHCMCNIENNSRDASVLDTSDAYSQSVEKKNILENLKKAGM